MTKQDFIKELENARSTHVKWHAYAQALAMGLESGAEKLPQLYTDCTFGKWYYGVGHYLNFMPEFREIEPIHEKVHKLYMEIYNKYLSPTKSGLFKSSSKAQAQKEKEMNNMVAQLKEVSNMLIEKLSSIQKILSSMTDEELKSKM